MSQKLIPETSLCLIYSVIVKIGDKNKTYTMDQNEWKSLKLVETTKLKVYKFGTATIPKEK